MLCFLQHPSVVEKTVSLMQTTKAKVPDFDAEVMKRNKGYGARILSSMESKLNILNIHFLFCLKDVQKGWTMDHRKVYLAELKTLMSKKGGNMFTGYIEKIRNSAIASVPEKDKASLQYLMGEVNSIDFANLPSIDALSISAHHISIHSLDHLLCMFVCLASYVAWHMSVYPPGL